jgi:hypothetical protein
MGGVAGICHDMNQDHWGHGQRSPKVIRLVIPTDSTPGPPQVRLLQIAVTHRRGAGMLLESKSVQSLAGPPGRQRGAPSPHCSFTR